MTGTIHHTPDKLHWILTRLDLLSCAVGFNMRMMSFIGGATIIDQHQGVQPKTCINASSTWAWTDSI